MWLAGIASLGATEHSTHGIGTGRAETSYGGEVEEVQASGQQNRPWQPGASRFFSPGADW
jgi:hypothetical protein